MESVESTSIEQKNSYTQNSVFQSDMIGPTILKQLSPQYNRTEKICSRRKKIFFIRSADEERAPYGYLTNVFGLKIVQTDGALIFSAFRFYRHIRSKHITDPQTHDSVVVVVVVVVPSLFIRSH